MQKYYNSVISGSGAALKDVSVSVYVSGTQNLAPIFSDNGITPLGQPLTTEDDGSFYFFAANGLYDLVFTKVGFVFDGDDTAKITLYDPGNALALGSASPGSILFQGPTGISQDNVNLFWDDSNNRLGVGTSNPAEKLHIIGDAQVVRVKVTDGVEHAGLDFQLINVTDGGRISFLTDAAGGSGLTEKMRLTDAGILAVGTTVVSGASAGDLVIEGELRGRNSINITKRLINLGGDLVQLDADAVGIIVGDRTVTGILGGDIGFTNSAKIRFFNSAGTTHLDGLGFNTLDQLVLGADATDIKWSKALVALGGGAAPTLGTIGGSGPATAAQNTWLRAIDSTGAPVWIPAWK